MTVQLERARAAGRAEPLRSPLVSGATAALWAGVLGLAVIAVPVLVVWAAAPHDQSTPQDALQIGGLAWLMAHGASLTTPDGDLSLLPLGLLAVPALLLYRSGHWAGRVAVDAARSAAAAVATLVATYAATAYVVSHLSHHAGSGADPASVLLGSALLALTAGGLGVVRGGQARGLALRPLTAAARSVLRGAGVGLAVLLGGAAAVLAVALLAHAGRVVELVRAVAHGPAGVLSLLVLGLLLLPNAVLWAAAYSVGPGFAVGVATSVAPTGVRLGDVPSFPLLGALPGSGSAPAVSLLAVLVPVLAGALVGLHAVRTRPDGDQPGAVVVPVRAALSGLLAGVALGGLALLTSGSLGSGRMSVLGPDGWPVGLAAAVEVAAVAALTGWAAGRYTGAVERLLKGTRDRWGAVAARLDPRRRG